jgi:hypothetical protein
MMIMSFFWKLIIIWIQLLIKQWTKPATQSLISVILSDLTRSRTDLVFENALLRQQMNGLRSSCVKQHPGVKARNISCTIPRDPCYSGSTVDQAFAIAGGQTDRSYLVC